MNSVKKSARAAGVLYLVIFIISPVAILVSKSGLLVPGDADATVNSIMASSTLYRLGIVAETVIFLVEIVMAAILYELLKPVNKTLSLAAAFARLAEAIVQAVNLLPSVIVLMLVSGASYLTVFDTSQLNALVLLFANAYEYLVLVWGFLFGLHLLLLGYLVYKADYFPRFLGILLMVASAGYLLQSYGAFLIPQYQSLLDTFVMVVAIPGELAFTIYLLWKGIDVKKWKEHTPAVK